MNVYREATHTTTHTLCYSERNHQEGKERKQTTIMKDNKLLIERVRREIPYVEHPSV
jgi:hypothetical protein